MKQGLIAWWARNPVAANLLMVGILISGALSFMNMNREVWPTIQANWVEVSVAWPGAAPREVEEQILLRVEEVLSDLDNIERLRGYAREGGGSLYIEADPRIDMGDFIAEVKLRVDSIVSLPRDIEPLRVREILTRNNLVRVAIHGDVEEKILKRTAERVRQEIAAQPGAAIVELFGARQEEVSIELSEQAMRRYGLTFDQVAQAIRGSSINLSSGTVRTSNAQFRIQARNLADTAADFEQIVVRQTDDGGIIRVGDVATVIDGFEDEEILATFNGEPAILVDVMTTEQMNVVQTSDSVNRWLDEESEKFLPQGVEATLWFDQSKIYTDRIQLIGSSAFLGLMLVFILLLLTLAPRVAIWVTIGIATAFAGAFIFLPSNGVSLNMLSLFAFLLVIGIVVDDAIVIGEGIHQQHEKGNKGVDAAVLGAQLVAKPVIFAVLTSMISFLPWLLLSGLQVQFTRQISIIIILALTFSLIEALLILPAHLSHKGWLTSLGSFLFGWLERGLLGRTRGAVSNGMRRFADGPYRRAMNWSLRYRYITTALFFASLILSMGLFSTGWVKFSFMPEVEDEQVSVTVTLPEGTSFERAQEILRQLQQGQRQMVANVRQEFPNNRLVDNWYTRARPNEVLAIVVRAPPEVRPISAKDVADRLRAQIGEIPDAEELTVGFTINQSDPDLQFAVSHQDLELLREATAALRAQLATYDTVLDVRDDLQSASEELQLTLRPGAQKLGLTLSEVSRQVRQAYFGEEVQRLARMGDDVRVMLRLPEAERRSLDSLEDLRIRLSDGREVPLLSVAEIDYAPGISRINRRERFRAAVVTADLGGADRRPIMDDLEETFFPQWEEQFPGVRRGTIGQAEGEAEFFAEVGMLYTICLFAMYALIAIAFRSYFLPALVMVAIPFGFMGAVYGHLLFGMPLALFSFFGIGAAAGVVVNDNLVLVDYVNRLRDQGLGAFEALVEAGVARFRPIVLTSATTFIGLIPMMAEQSTQAQFLKPTVVSLSFAVLLATGVTLILVPSLYGIGVDVGRGTQRLFTGRKRGAFGSHHVDRPQPGPAE